MTNSCASFWPFTLSSPTEHDSSSIPHAFNNRSGLGLSTILNCTIQSPVLLLATEADTRHNRSSSTKSMLPPPHEMDLKFFASGQRMEHGQPISDDSSRPMYTEEQLAGESSGSEAHSEPSADSSSAPSALDLRKDELIQENLLKRKSELGEGQAVAQVRKAVETDFGIETKGGEFELIRQMEKEVGSSKKKQNPITNSIFNEIKDHQGKHLDGLGGGQPKSKDKI